jgi:hypothetical protein
MILVTLKPFQVKATSGKNNLFISENRVSLCFRNLEPQFFWSYRQWACGDVREFQTSSLEGVKETLLGLTDMLEDQQQTIRR